VWSTPFWLMSMPVGIGAKNAEVKVYPGAGHGLFATYKKEFDDDLLAFIQP
jgi:hypothetical protein